MSEKEKKTEEKEKKEDKHYIVFTDEKGKDTNVELLFSIVYKKNNTRYLYVIDPTDDESVIIFSADDDGNLESMSDDNMDADLREFLEDTFQAFQSGDLAPVTDGEEGEEEEIEEEDSEECECCCGDQDCECQHDEGEEHECCHGEHKDDPDHKCRHEGDKDHSCCHNGK